MLKHLSILAAALLMSVPVAISESASTNRAASHQTKPLLELYTSQSCGLCPKANRQFAQFAGDNEVVALTFPVDYWDYLGWKDTFAEPAFGDRQKDYNTSMGRRGPYTPQVVFHGADHCSATREKSMRRKADKASAESAKDAFRMSYDGQEITLSEPIGEAELWIVEYKPGLSHTTPTSGVNQDKEMVYFNRVVGLQKFDAPFTAQKIAAPCPSSCVAIVQKPGPGAVLAVDQFETPISG